MNQVSLHKDGTVSFFNRSRGRIVRDCIIPADDLLAMSERDQKRVRKHLAQIAWFDDAETFGQERG